MANFAQFFDSHAVNMDENDFFKKFGITQKVSLENHFGGQRFREEDLVFPIFTNYKMVSLD
jgi:hypothetical protein